MEDQRYLQALRIAHLLEKELSGKLETSEWEELEKWLQEDPVNHALYKELQDPVQREAWIRQLQAYNTTAALERVKAKAQRSVDIRKPYRKVAYRVAAVLVLLAVALAFYQVQWQSPTLMQVQVALGEQKEVILDDGSRVRLNAGTVFSYPERFSGSKRTVNLISGEAFFEVSPDKKHPFVIETDQMAVEVLGTSFNVKAYPDDPTAEVSVKTGRVEVATADQHTLLLPGQKTILKNSNLTRAAVNTDDIAAWTENRLVFDNHALGEIFRVLERHYNIEILVNKPDLLKERVTLTLKEQPLNAVLETLSFTKTFAYEITTRQDRTIVRIR